VLAQRWDCAALVVLTAAALEALPAGLSHRPGVYLCVAGEIAEGDWPAITRLQPGAVVLLPAGRPWLAAQLADPAAALQAGLVPAAGCSG